MIDLGYHPISLGETAENVSVREHIGRAEQDSYAARSQDRYARAKADGFFAAEIQAVHNGKELVSEDEHPRAGSTIEKLGKLKPAFKDGGTNPNGGAIAIGHPIAASGARLAGTLLRELERRNGRYGIATMCIGVGQGLATLFERES